MKKLLIPLLLIPPLALGALICLVLYEGPRMRTQHHLRDFQMSLPNLPPESRPVHPLERLPSPPQAALLHNPLPGTPGNLARAGVYYRYYCVFCHGDTGAGDGPVGQSYLPRPADLRRLRPSGDGELLRAMLTGTGHEPVLEQVVPPEHRWYLVLLLRSLAGA